MISRLGSGAWGVSPMTGQNPSYPLYNVEKLAFKASAGSIKVRLRDAQTRPRTRPRPFIGRVAVTPARAGVHVTLLESLKWGAPQLMLCSGYRERTGSGSGSGSGRGRDWTLSSPPADYAHAVPGTAKNPGQPSIAR
jgi:hypothetical protein